MKFHVVTLGCQMNTSDSERVRTVIEGLGYTWSDNEQEAELLGIIACSVRQKSIDKVYSRISKWNKWKNKKNLITFISGCVLSTDKEKFLKLFDLLFEIKDLPSIGQMLSQYGVVTIFSLKGTHPENTKKQFQFDPKEVATESVPCTKDSSASRKSFIIDSSENDISKFWKVSPTYNSDWEAFIPIQNGCDKFCSFCAVPYTRGREVSRPSSEIVKELKILVNKGYKSITLLGQNVNSYGLDKKNSEITFAELLTMIGKFGIESGKEFWVYFTSPHPKDMTKEVIEIIAKYKCLGKQIHLPMQSGDDEVLIRMNRKHSIDDYRKIIYTIHELLTEATIFTDIIVGFAGETDEQFENTRIAMKEFKFNMAYIAKYSPRPGAKSSGWKDDITNEIKTKRLHILTDELTKHSLNFNRSLIGKSIRVIVSGKDKKEGYLSALTEGKIVLRFPSDDPSLIGNFTTVHIDSATDYALQGVLNSHYTNQYI